MLGLGVLLVRRNVPESPRWLFIHGREEEAERDRRRASKREVAEQTGEALPEARGEPITVRQRRTIPLRTIVRSVVTMYPRRTMLGLALFVGQAFLYNALLFGLGNLLEASSNPPGERAVLPRRLRGRELRSGRCCSRALFDTVGRSR